MYEFPDLTQDDEAANDEWEAGIDKWWKTLLVGLAEILTSYADHLSKESKYLESSEYYQASTKIHDEYHIIQGLQGIRIRAKLFKTITGYVNNAIESKFPSICMLKYTVDLLETSKKYYPTEWKSFNNAEKVKSTIHQLLNKAQKKIDQKPITPNEITYSKDRLFPISPKSSTNKIEISDDVPKRDTIRRRGKWGQA